MANKTAKEKQKEIEKAARAALAQQAHTNPPTGDEAQQATDQPTGGEAAQDSTQPPTNNEAQQPSVDPPAGDESQEAAKEPYTDSEAQETAEIKEEPLEGKALVIYNGYINIRRAPLMTDDAICGQVRRGQVLNVIASVNVREMKFFKLAGGEYIKADAKLVEFKEADIDQR